MSWPPGGYEAPSTPFEMPAMTPEPHSFEHDRKLYELHAQIRFELSLRLVKPSKLIITDVS